MGLPCFSSSSPVVRLQSEASFLYSLGVGSLWLQAFVSSRFIDTSFSAHLNFSTFFPVMENSQAGHVLVFGWRIYYIRFVLIRQTDTQPGHARKTDILEFELIQTLYKS